MADPIPRLNRALEGRYTVERELGEGGMATVYLAEDVRHDRKVAIKVLKPELAAIVGAERFLAEIKTTANLQHPHILPLHDSGDADGFLYYVMPYVAGESLRERLEREKQLPVGEALRLTAEVADALAYAHAQGVVHRDIKPENVLLHNDRALVADFGIALAVQQAGGGRLTETGLSLGTPNYMSPEQATAEQQLDERSDQYSLACVLYEMLAGEPPHTGPTAQAIVASILARKPEPVEERRATTPPHVAEAVSIALEKLPADRFRSVGAFAEAIAAPGSMRPRPPPAPVSARRVRWLVPWALVAVLLVALTQNWGGARDTRVTRFTVQVPEGLGVFFWDWSGIAIAPDGRTLAYVSDGLVQLRDMDAFDTDARTVGGSEGAVFPFFSPDGSSVGFTDDEARFLRRAPVTGNGSAVRIGAGSGLAPTWVEERWIVTDDALGARGIWRIATDGAEREQITTVMDSEGEAFHAAPHVLPDGSVLFTAAGPDSGWRDSRIAIWEPGVPGHRTVVDQATTPLWVTAGYLLYTRDGAVWAQPFDMRTHEVTGSPVVVLQDVMVTVAGTRMNVSVSNDGTLVYALTPEEEMNHLLWVDRQGSVQDTIGVPLHGAFPRVSGDGESIALEIRNPGETDIWILDAVSGTPTRFTFEPVEDETPQWSSDGQRIAYASARTGQERRIFVAPIDRDTDPVLVYTSEYHAHLSDWSEDDEWLVLHAPVPGNGNDIWVTRADGSDSLMEVAVTEEDERDAVFSPDGAWLAYSAGVDGKTEIYLVSFPGLGSRQQVSDGGGRSPRWSADGTELFYQRGTSVMSVPMTGEGVDRTPGTPVPLFEMPTMFEYEPAPDGERFLLRVLNEAALVREIHVVLNWFEELGEG